MSLDVYLEVETEVKITSGVSVREGGRNVEISMEEWNRHFPDRGPVTMSSRTSEVYEDNITHNLGKMAGEAGIYEALWRPEEVGITKAEQLIEPLQAGLKNLKTTPEIYREHNPSNGWGSYEGLTSFVERYIDACKEYPEATVSVSR